MTKSCCVIARLSLVPAKNIRFLDIPKRLAKLLQNLLVSQLVRVILATVNLPRESNAIGVATSSTLKSETRAFKTPPIPTDLVA
jgi:hypothetical protein